MIDGEITLLVPEWSAGPGIEETPCFANQGLCHNCASNHTSNGSLMGFFLNTTGTNNLQCCRQGCASMHGRFEEIMYQAEESEQHGASNESSKLDCLQQYQQTWDQHESRELSSIGSGQSHSDEEYERLHQSVSVKDGSRRRPEDRIASNARNFTYHLADGECFSSTPSICCDPSDNYENEIQRELRWLKAKYLMEMREIRDKQLGLGLRSTNYVTKELTSRPEGIDYNHFHSSEDIVTAKSFYSSSLLPLCLHRTTSLPVDAVDL